MPAAAVSDATRALSAFAATVRFADLPTDVRAAGVRTFVNVVGCALGGARHESVEIAERALGPHGGPAEATVIGRAPRRDMLLAALLNGMSSSVYSFDDTHAQAVVHPGGPVASAILALAESRVVTGSEFLAAFIAGVEVVCRASMAVSVAPAKAGIGWIQTGIVGGIGAAAAASRLLGLDAEHTAWALGIAASAGSGMRGLSRSMCFSLMAGNAAQAGLRAALLAAADFTSADDGLEAPHGFASVFAVEADLAAFTVGLGERYEVLANTFKPYPCGIVIHPAIDAALELRQTHSLGAAGIERIHVRVNPTAAKLVDMPRPRDPFEAAVSLQHWVAAVIVDGRAGVEVGTPAKINDLQIVALRERIAVEADNAVARDASSITVTLTGGREVNAVVEHGRGSALRPMTDAELDDKFITQAVSVLPHERAAALLAQCRNIAALDDVGALARAAGA